MHINRNLSLSILFCIVSGCGTSTSIVTPKLDGGTATGDMAVAAKADMAMAVRDMAMVNNGPCDPIAQDCVGAGLKCTFIDDGSGSGMLSTGCVMAGSDMVGGSCTRATMMQADIGKDSCAKGSFCSNIGTLASPSQLHCRAICTADADCGGGGAQCIQELQQPSIGVCAPTCTLFGGNADCDKSTGAKGMFNCDALYINNDGTTPNFICRIPGKLALGATCMLPTDCVANADCIDPTGMNGTRTCTPYCDPKHACAKGKCTPVVMGSAIGVCI